MKVKISFSFNVASHVTLTVPDGDTTDFDDEDQAIAFLLDNCSCDAQLHENADMLDNRNVEFSDSEIVEK